MFSKFQNLFTLQKQNKGVRGFFFFFLGLNIQRRKDIREVLDLKDEEAFLVYRGL